MAPVVLGGSEGVFLIDNAGGVKHYGLCGSISWRLDNLHDEPVFGSSKLNRQSRRVVITYRVPYS